MTLSFRQVVVALLLCLSLPVAQGESAPFSDLSGKPAALAQFTGQGQWTVVMIWASDCGVCRHEAPELEDFHQRHSAGLAQVLGLSVDGAAGMAAARSFVRDTGLTFPSLVGDAEEVAALFYDETGNHLIGTPAFLIYNPQGKLRTYQTGRLNLLALEHLIRPQANLSVARGQ